MSLRRIYFDNAATSFPKPPSVAEAMTHYATEIGASAGRGGYAEAVESGRIISECRQRINRLIHGQRAEHVIFTLNCSDGLNLAIKGLIDPAKKNHAICTHIDHNSILRPLNTLEQRGAVAVTRMPIDPTTQQVDPDAIARAIRPETRLIAVTHASNVTGVIQPIGQIGRIARERDIPFIVDAAQSAGHVPIDVRQDNIDLLAAPGHKALMGPLGTGFLYIRPGIESRLATLKEGGTGSISESDIQPDFLPDKYEPGSHNAIGIAGLSAGVQWVLEHSVEKLAGHDANLLSTFFDAIADAELITSYGPPTVRNRVGVVSLRIEGLDPQELAAVFESSYGILSRAGLHCAPLAHKNLGTLDSGGTTRLSFGPFITAEDVHYAAESAVRIGRESVSKPLRCPADKG